jgi:hypothetical protein
LPLRGNRPPRRGAAPRIPRPLRAWPDPQANRRDPYLKETFMLTKYHSTRDRIQVIVECSYCHQQTKPKRPALTDFQGCRRGCRLIYYVCCPPETVPSRCNDSGQHAFYPIAREDKQAIARYLGQPYIGKVGNIIGYPARPSYRWGGFTSAPSLSVPAPTSRQSRQPALFGR